MEPRNAAHRHEGSPFLHSALPAPAPDRKQRPLPSPARNPDRILGNGHISPPSRVRVIHGFGGQVPVHVASDDRGRSSSYQQPSSSGTDCQPGAASQSDRPCACSSPARVSFAFGGHPPVGCAHLQASTSTKTPLKHIKIRVMATLSQTCHNSRFKNRPSQIPRRMPYRYCPLIILCIIAYICSCC